MILHQIALVLLAEHGLAARKLHIVGEPFGQGRVLFSEQAVLFSQEAKKKEGIEEGELDSFLPLPSPPLLSLPT